jgi:two-component system, cell cycle sensor histidine kinase and response regulator CckA
MQLSAEDEGSRLRALAECRIVDSPPEEFFDDIANQAAYLCGTPIGFVSFIDSQREWLKARVGWEITEIPRDQSFNALVLGNPHVLVVEDIAADRRFRLHPWGQSGMRFYASAPVVTKEGYVLGAISVVDRLPRSLPAGHRRILQTLANAIAARLDLRRASFHLATSGSNPRQQLLSDQNAAGFYRTSPDGRILACNRALARMLGCASKEELIGCQAQQFYYSPEERHQFLKDLQREGSLVNSELHLRRKDGSSIWVVENVAATRDEQGNLTLIEGTMVDITAHKRAEDALRDSQERMLGIITSAMDAIITVDEKQKIIVFNKAAEEIFRCTAAEVIGQSIDRFIPESLREIHREHIRNFGQSGVSTRSMYSPRTLVAVRSNGEEFPIETSLSQVTTSSEKLYTVILRDISGRKRTEDQLRQSQKMEAVGHLAGGIAHEFNNYLAIIMGYTELLERETIGNDSLRMSLSEIKGASQKVASLTRQLLAFSRKQVIEPREVDLNSVVWETHKLLRRLIPVTIDLIPKLQDSVGKVKADPAQIQQILINLVLNARDSMPAGGQIVIETAEVELDEEYASRQLEVQPGRYVMLTVADTGIGMDKETLSRIFEPFFTTKEEGKGTGLGLSTTYGIVKQSGGHLTVASVPGKGSTFSIYLPRMADPDIIMPQPTRAQSEQPRRQTVLVVEDDSALRKLMMKVLEGAGFQVVEAKDGEQALEICKRWAEPIDIVVSDLAMPKLNGFQLKEIVAGLCTTVRFLLISGYAEDVVEDPTILQTDTNFLEKPFLPDELILKVRQILGSESGEPPAVESAPPADVGT